MSTHRSLVRVAGILGLLATLILIINAAKRAGLFEPAFFNQLLSPFGAMLGTVAIVGLFVYAAPVTKFAAIAAAANIVAMTGLVGGEFITNLVFDETTASGIQTLLQGPLRAALVGIGALYIVATCLLVLALWRSALPQWALVVYAAGTIGIGLRVLLPSGAVPISLLLLSVGLAALSLHLLRAQPDAATKDADRLGAVTV